jgi:siroheme synthase-like protein
MGFLPIFMEMRGRDCLVVGGGAIAESRVRALLQAEAAVTVVAPVVTHGLTVLAGARAIRHSSRNYVSDDVRGRFMAWAAVDDPAIAKRVAEDARRMGVPLNAADRPGLCDFITPAVLRRGPIQIAITTGGASPALSRRLRERLENIVGPEYASLAEILRQVRQWLRGRVRDPNERARTLKALLDSDLPLALRDHDRAAADRVVRSYLGAGLSEAGFRFESDDLDDAALPPKPSPPSFPPTPRES